MKPDHPHATDQANATTEIILDGRYRLLEELGRGGMGVVHKAEDLRFQKRYVVVKQNLQADQKHSRRLFQQEANMMAVLGGHQNLPDVTDYHLDEKYPLQYMVMEFVEGQNLRDQLATRKQPFVESEVRVWVEQIMGALAYMHSYEDPEIGRANPICHLDVKPSNIIRTRSNRIFLVDLGLAKYGLDLQKPIGGTKGYAAPEQETGPVDHRADIYGLGATIYTLLTKIVPPASTELAKDGKQLSLPSAFNPSVTPEMDVVVARTMAIDPAQRYRNINEMYTALFGADRTLPEPMPLGRKPHTPKAGRVVGWRGAVALILSIITIFLLTTESNEFAISRRINTATTTLIARLRPPTPIVSPPAQAPVTITPSPTATPVENTLTATPTIMAANVTVAPCPFAMKLLKTADHEFCLDIHEVTVKAYLACPDKICSPIQDANLSVPWRMPQNMSYFTPESLYPVVNVTWQQADRYCRHYRGTTSAITRLPTTEEWLAATQAVEQVSVDTALALTTLLTVTDTMLAAPAIGIYGLVGNVKEWVDASEILNGKLVLRGRPVGYSFTDQENDFTAEAYLQEYTFEKDELAIELREDWGFRCAADPLGSQ